MLTVVRRFLSALSHRRWLLSRRLIQISIVLAFVVEIPDYGRIAEGNLSSSVWFKKLSLTDPFIWLQSMLAGGSLAMPALMGAAIIAAFYAFFGGRIYCSWVCPINMLTDLAYWLRQKLNIKGNLSMTRQFRVVILVLSLLLSALAGTLAWELINPITLFQRELMWGSLAGSMMLLALFLFDLLVSRRGWCGHLCPVGAFYAILGRYGRLRVTKRDANACAGTACSACVKVCPEPHVLAPVVSDQARSVTSGDCTRCGACLDNCKTGALSMKLDVGKGSGIGGIPVVASDK
ncbi:MAG: quinol dehydrogenase ferredoxin subunit NapH [Methylophaga sp.]